MTITVCDVCHKPSPEHRHYTYVTKKGFWIHFEHLCQKHYDSVESIKGQI